MKVARFPILVVFVFVILIHSTAAYSITIEEFIEKHPDAVVALCANYYENGRNEWGTASSGLLDNDPYALEKSNIMSADDLYKSEIISDDVWRKMIDKADNYYDLIDDQAEISITITYADSFFDQELVPISEEVGLDIVEKIFDGFFDGYNTQEIREDYPVFYLQLSTKDDLYLDTEDDADMRMKGIDPTPPLYGN